MSEVIKKDSIALCIPCAGPVEPVVMTSFMRAVSMASAAGLSLDYFGMTNRQLIHSARENLAMGFLASTAEWSLWLDSDMVLPGNTIIEMVKWAKGLNTKIVTGVYHQREGEFYPLAMLNTVYGQNGEVIRKGADKFHSFFLDIPESVKDAVKVDSCGFGCVLIHREVFEKMERPYFKFLFGDQVPGMKPWEYVSEDFYFCTNARDLGYEIYALPALDLGHLGSPALVGRKEYNAAKAKKRMEESKEKITK